MTNFILFTLRNGQELLYVIVHRFLNSSTAYEVSFLYPLGIITFTLIGIYTTVAQLWKWIKK